MASMQNIAVILNPIAGSGRAGKMGPALGETLARHFGEACLFLTTDRPLDAIRLARQAVKAGAQLIIVAGGDGTLQEVANGLYEGRRLINPNCELGIINFGTGQGFAQSLGIPSSMEAQIAILEHRPASPVDVGCVTCQSTRNGSIERLFINECQAGIGGDVVAQVNRGYKLLGGKWAFGLSAVQKAFRGHAYTITTTIDGGEPISDALIGLAIGNGSRMGGGMQLTPGARPDDGLFDILFIHRMNLLQRLSNFTRIYSGQHLQSRHFSLFRGRKISLESREAVPVEADGELLGWLPAEIELLPEPLKVKSNLK